MQPTSSMKEEFLKKWQMGLQIFRPSIDNTSVSERKKAIKLSADVAMASLRKGTTCWSRALIEKTATEDNFLVRQMLTGIKAEALINKKLPKKIVCHRKIVRRSKKILRRKSRSASEEAAVKAKRLVKRRTQGLRNVVPGGEFMSNDILLLRETLDYIVSLQTQVNVMRSIVDAAEAGIEQ
ncbi:Transcription factor IBH1-like 1 [Cardamine amara subsp. amara]|uniref:Transcription factor IBH1-like 1 n=1 Tax=Cardamine amara subsp. amara TaxID=228776 RepID=A0ABD1AUW3_CARAN